ncbi:MAG TPA: hypothetical protein VMT67_13870 [Terriglobales bacterium]|nr:hypothetical protein [Terriglobales bacterium]
MSTPTQSHDSAADPGWPVTAIPQRWVEALFATMSSTYGARFADLWRGTEIAQVKRQWGIELAKLTSAQMKAGRENLMQLVKAPTCPEFIAHCRQSRMEAAASTAFQIENTPKTTVEEASRNLGAVRNAINKLSSSEPTAEWAYKLLMRGKSESGGELTYEIVRCASDAISSSAGRKAIQDCTDPVLREEYRMIRDSIVEGYQAAGQPLWGTR